jgi:hypothetical protein
VECEVDSHGWSVGSGGRGRSGERKARVESSRVEMAEEMPPSGRYVEASPPRDQSSSGGGRSRPERTDPTKYHSSATAPDCNRINRAFSLGQMCSRSGDDLFPSPPPTRSRSHPPGGGHRDARVGVGAPPPLPRGEALWGRGTLHEPAILSRCEGRTRGRGQAAPPHHDASAPVTMRASARTLRVITRMVRVGRATVDGAGRGLPQD